MALSPTDFANVHLKKLNDYVTGVTGNTIVTGDLERLAVERFIEFKSKYIFRQDRLIHILKFFSLINVVINDELKQIELLDYHVFWLANLYALYRDNERRLHDLAYISLSKKNAKTQTFAAASIYEVCQEGDGEVNADCILLAASREQAYKVILKTVTEMINNSPALRKKFKVTRNIISRRTAVGTSTIQIRSTDVSTIQGGRTSFCLADEYAAWQSSELADKVKTGMINRKNPLLVMITTAGNNLASPAKTMHDLCEQILNGEVEMDNVFAQIFAIGKDEIDQLPTNPQLYRKCNPGLGHCVTIDSLQANYKQSKHINSSWQVFLTDNLNQWTNDETQGDVFIDDETIVSCMGDYSIPTGATIYAGNDLSRNKDLTSCSRLFYNVSDGTFLFDVDAILPNINARKIREHGSIDFDKAGWMITPDNPKGYIHTSSLPVLDESIIFNLYKDWKAKYKIQRVGFDPHLCGQIFYRLEKELKLNCVHIPQNWKLTQPISFFERLVYLGKVKIVRNPLVRWNFQNCLLVRANGMSETLRLSKRNKEAIDCVISMVVSLSSWMYDNQNRYNAIIQSLDELDKLEKQR
jgi:phage terminase large subunit-like protein